MRNVGMAPVVLAVFSVLVLVGSAAAQRTFPVDISIRPGIGKSLETDCPSYSEGGTRVEAEITGITGAGGVRFYFQPLTARVRGFAGLGVGYTTGNVKVSALGLTESVAGGGFGVAPAVGVEAGVTPSLLVRISAGTAFAFTDEGPTTALSVAAALAFRVGGPQW